MGRPPREGVGREGGSLGERVLLDPDEPVEGGRRDHADERHVRHGTDQVGGGAPGVGALRVAPGDRGEVLGLAAREVAHVGRGCADLPRAGLLLAEVPAGPGDLVPVEAEPGAHDGQGAHEHPDGDLDVPDPPPEHLAQGSGHVPGVDEPGPGRSVGRPVVARGVQQCGRGDAADVLVRGWRVAAVPGGQGEDAQLRGQADEALQVVVGEEARVDDHVGRVGNHGEEPVDQPALAGGQGRVVGLGQPLGETDDGLHPLLPGRGGEGDRAVQHVGVPGRHVVEPLDVAHGRAHLVGVEHVGHHHLGAGLGQPPAALVLGPHQCPDGHVRGEQRVDDDRPGLPGRSGDEDPGPAHAAPASRDTVVGAGTTVSTRPVPRS